MKQHTTNYTDTFIEIADDCPISLGEIPPQKGDAKTAANIQFELISKNPYQYTSDDVLFQVFAYKNDLTQEEYTAEREKYFSKGQACMRASALTKRYGWGIHHDKEGKMAIYGADSIEYQELAQNLLIKKVKAMKSSR